MDICFNWRLALNALCLFPVASVAATAAEPAPSTLGSATQQAQEFVHSALQAEAEGDFLARQRLLQSAENCAADCPELKWQQGYVKIKDAWLSIDDCVAATADDKLLAEYETRRLQLSDTLQNHLALAQWCVEKGCSRRRELTTNESFRLIATMWRPVSRSVIN